MAAAASASAGAPNSSVAPQQDVVYALHDFLAENPDEISFKAGERIIILERDEQYQDGWYQGENSRGERGLFPQTYTQELPINVSANTSATAAQAQEQQQQQPLPDANTSGAAGAGAGAGAGGAAPLESSSRSSIHSRNNSVSSGAPIILNRRASTVTNESIPRASASDTQVPPVPTLDRLGEHDLRRESVSSATSSVLPPVQPLNIQPSVGRTSGPQTLSVQQSSAPGGASPSPIPATPADEASSVTSQSLRDDASSINDREEEDDSVGHGAGQSIAAKDALTRNIELAREKEEQRRLAEERARQEEIERMRATAPPIDGLVISDESDAEESPSRDTYGKGGSMSASRNNEEEHGDDDDDSIFPSRTYVPSQPIDSLKEQQTLEEPTSLDAIEKTPQPFSAPRFSTAQGTPLQGSPQVAEEMSRSATVQPVPSAPMQAAAVPENTAATPGDDNRSALQHVGSSQSSFYPNPSPYDGPRSDEAESSPLNDGRDASNASTSVQQSSTLLSQSIERESADQSQQVDKHPEGASSTAPSAAFAVGSTSGAIAQPPSPRDSGLSESASKQSASPQQRQQGVSSPSASVTASALPGTSPYPSTVASSMQHSSEGHPTRTSLSSLQADKSPTSPQFTPVRHIVTSDPREWTVDQVVEWAQGRHLDSAVLSKFREHEITGDVLVDMDINTLREIDIIAFGPRARIAKAIKELRAYYEPAPPSSTRSRTASGYEQDFSSRGTSPTPASAQDESFMSTGLPTGLEQGVIPEEDSASASDARREQLMGLGLQAQPDLQRSATETTAMPTSSPSRDASGATQDTSIASNADKADLSQTLPPLEPDIRRSDAPRHKTSTGSNVTGTLLGRHGRNSSAAASGTDASDSEKAGKALSRSFFGGSISKSRKPPPRYSSGTESMERSSSVMDRLFSFGSASPNPSNASRESTKPIISAPLEAPLPGSPGQSAPPTMAGKGPALPSSSRAAPSPVVVSSPSIPPNTSPAPVAPPKKTATPTTRQTTAPPAALANATTAAGTQTPRQKIGEPDYSGWLRKRGDRYNTWKERYLILKGVHLYILKGPNEDKVKGWINLIGYRFISDGSVGSSVGEKNKFGFKAVKDGEQTHYFSSHDSTITKNWMKELMKATIGRDLNAPVTSSANIKTIPLTVAQSMNPPPRPPSPSSVARVQKATLSRDPSTLSPTEAARLMGALVVPSSPSLSQPSTVQRESVASQTNGSPSQTSPNAENRRSGLIPPIRSGGRKKPVSDEMSSAPTTTSTTSRAAEDQPAATTPMPLSTADTTITSNTEATAASSTVAANSAHDDALLDWMNEHLPSGTPKALEWSDMCSGRIYTRVVENLCGKKSGISDTEFDKFKPVESRGGIQTDYIETLFSCFDFLLDQRIDTMDVSINDLLTNNQPHMVKLAGAVRSKFDA